MKNEKGDILYTADIKKISKLYATNLKIYMKWTNFQKNKTHQNTYRIRKPK